MTAKHMHHQLATIANTKNRNAPGIDFRINSRRILQISAVRTAGKNNTLRIFSLNCFQAMLIGYDFAVHAAFTYASGD